MEIVMAEADEAAHAIAWCRVSEIVLRFALARMVSGSLVQRKGSQRSFQPSMKARMASMRSRTESKLPRRMAWRVMMPKKISTRFNQDPEVGVKCSVMRGLRASQAFTRGCLCVA